MKYAIEVRPSTQRGRTAVAADGDRIFVTSSSSALPPLAGGSAAVTNGKPPDGHPLVLTPFDRDSLPELDGHVPLDIRYADDVRAFHAGGAVDPDRRDITVRDAQGVQVGHGNVQFNFFTGQRPAAARSAYLEQVRRIAPPELRGREQELAELARFCLDLDEGPYLWWQAGPWAGKSALLSTFVLHPPPEVAERVRIVSFFITARLSSQDTCEAFTEVLLARWTCCRRPRPPARGRAGGSS